MTPRFRADGSRQHAIGAARLPAANDSDWILAAVHHDEIGVDAWRRIRDDIDPMVMPDGHSRLAPLIYETILGADPDHPLLRSFARTRLTRLASLKTLSDAVAPVIDDLRDRGIDVMVLKGAALGDVYGSPARRPMADVDLLVRPCDLPVASEVLSSHGLVCHEDILQPVKVACVHSASFVPMHGGPGNIDLHWMASPQLAPKGIARAQWKRPWFRQISDDEFWSRARVINFAGREVSAPNTTDLLLLVVLHGVRFGIADDTRWAVDAAMILRNCSDEIDWNELVEQSIRRNVSSAVAHALRYLNDNVLIGSLSGSIPERVITDLRAHRLTKRERIIDGSSRREHEMDATARRIVVDVLIRHLVLTANEPFLDSLRSFPWFVALWLGVERPRQIPGFLKKGTWRERLPSS